jgi:hypothetical protein
MRRLIFPILLLGALGLAGGCRPAPAPVVAEDPAAGEARAFIERYFEVWSANRMDEYGALFAPQALVHYVTPAGELQAWPLEPFLASQREAQGGDPAREFPLSIDLRISPDGKAAQAAVRWKLVKGSRTDLGWDHFTLMRLAGQWRIIHLVFYGE